MKIQILKMMMHLVFYRFYMKICQYSFGRSVSNLEQSVHEIWKCVLYVLESLVCLLDIFYDFVIVCLFVLQENAKQNRFYLKFICDKFCISNKKRVDAFANGTKDVFIFFEFEKQIRNN